MRIVRKRFLPITMLRLLKRGSRDDHGMTTVMVCECVIVGSAAFDRVT